MRHLRQSVHDPAIRDHLRGFAHLRYNLDFEFVQVAVSRWLGTRPYDELPFQWSCHLERADGPREHLDFLDLSGEPPMRAFA